MRIKSRKQVQDTRDVVQIEIPEGALNFSNGDLRVTGATVHDSGRGGALK